MTDTLAASSHTPAYPPIPAATLARVAFLGDSITDGYTYPQFVRDSLAASRGIAMVAINAGVGGDTMPGMLARLERDVLAYSPTLVTISAGANDAARGVTAEQYEAAMAGAVERLRSEGIEVILMTERCGKPTPIRVAYEAAIRKIAAAWSLRVAEVGKTMQAGADAGHPQFSQDGGHPGYTGQRFMARAVIDAMGYADIPVIDRVNAVLDPNVIREWQIRPVGPDESPLTADSIAKLATDATWKSVTTPFDKVDLTDINWDSIAWIDDFRRGGMATQLDKHIAPGARFISVSTIPSPTPAEKCLQTGADVMSVWLNGDKVFTRDDAKNQGWHPGRDAVQVRLNAAENTLVVESGTNMWIRIADRRLWT